jgi:uncharacterized membrane protein YphA (DoxX/SURF4 family)
MATGQKKGKMIALWVLRVVVGLAFLAAGGSKLAGAPAMVAMFAKIGSKGTAHSAAHHERIAPF